MGQDLFGVQLEQPLCHRDGRVELARLLQRADEPVHRVEHAGIHFEAAAKVPRGACRIALREQIERLVIEFFGGGRMRGRWHGLKLMITPRATTQKSDPAVYDETKENIFRRVPK